MSLENMIGAAMALPAVWGLLFYLRLWRAMPERENSEARLGVPDVLVAGLLALWFVSLILDSAGESLQVDIRAIVGSMVIYGGIVVILFLFLALRGISPIREFGLGNFSGLRIPSLVACFAALLPVVVLVQWVATLGRPAAESVQPILEFWMSNPDFISRGLVALMALVMAPLAEEVIFRGYLYGVARRYVGRGWAIAATALLFAGIHGHLPALPGLCVLAVMLTLAYERFRSLWAPILLHSTFNFLSLILSLLWPDLTL